ncbi:MAG TPA: nuclear transport factor 2 family protein [Ktedonobacteraceae bacterium]|nr:nuclear transport factor 2 family protein [Ktedonobacteraceae bacterium]
MSTREIVTSYFEYVNSHRWDDYLALFADNVVMDEQMLGHIEGIDQLRQGIEGLRNNTGFQNRPREIVTEGDRAMAIWHITAPQADGSLVEVDGANFYRIKDGKIVYFANYHDTAPFRAHTT